MNSKNAENTDPWPKPDDAAFKGTRMHTCARANTVETFFVNDAIDYL